MAIQLRRGNKADYDASKMLPGEVAIFTDTNEMVFKGSASAKVVTSSNVKTTDFISLYGLTWSGATSAMKYSLILTDSTATEIISVAVVDWGGIDKTVVLSPFINGNNIGIMINDPSLLTSLSKIKVKYICI